MAIPIQFDYCENFSNGYALIKQVDKWGATNKESQVVIDPNIGYQDAKEALKEKYGR